MFNQFINEVTRVHVSLAESLIEPSTFLESLTQLLWRKMNISNNNKDNLEDLK
ncbi:MAG: hypothetical protein AB7P56_01690 [Nitrososphaeraceae archaeon]